MTLESLVEEVGPIGRFQLMLIFLTLAPVMVSVMSMLFMVFGAVEPDWWCSSRGHHNQSRLSLWSNESHVTSMNGSGGTSPAPFVDGVGESSSVSNSGNITTDRFPAESATKVCEAVSRDDGACGEIVFSPGMSTIVTEFQLVCDKSWISSLTISLQMIGVLIGAAIAGQLADTVGRRKTLLIFTVLHAASCFTAACSVSWEMFAVMRVVIGFSIGGLLVTGFTYPTEFLGVKWRALFPTIPFWGLAAMTFSLLSWVLPHWLYLHVIIGTATVACLPGWLFLPESVRWLTVKGRVTEAHQVLCQMARWNGRKPPSLGSVQALCADLDPARSRRKYNYFHIFATCYMIKISSLTGWMWMCGSMAYFGISFGIKNMSGDFHLNFFLMSLMEIPSPLLVYHLCTRLGRRWTSFLGFFVVSLSMFTVVPATLFLPEDKAGIFVNVLCNLARFCIHLGWWAMNLSHAELYPTVVRNIGLGYCNTVCRIGSILAPFLLSVKEPYVFYSMIGGVTALTAVAALLLPETGGQPLQDNLEKTVDDSGKESSNGRELTVLNA